MKQYKITITSGNYPLSYTCDTISDAFECMRTLANWTPRIEIDPDDLMVALVQMRKNEVSAIKCNGYSITVLEEADADADLD